MAQDNGPDRSSRSRTLEALAHAGPDGGAPAWPVDLPPFEEFLAEIAAGFISVQRLGDLAIFNYTRTAQFSDRWTRATLMARGLIVNLRTGEIVARPFGKFFNLGQRYRTPDGRGAVATPPVGCPHEVTEKMDGALGIAFRDPATGGLRISTRGSFTSPQARAAQRIWDAGYAARRHLVPDELTLLMEIIAEESRVVVRYDFQDLVLIGAVDRFTGRELRHAELVELGSTLGMPVVRRLEGGLEEAQRYVSGLKADREGVVIAFQLPDGSLYRLKLKGGEYLKLHRVLTNTTPATIAEAWLNGSLAAVIAEVPDEFTGELRSAVAALSEGADRIRAAVESLYREGFALAEGDQGRYARWVKATAAADPSHLPPELAPILLGRPSLNNVERQATHFVAEALVSGALTEQLRLPGREDGDLEALARCEDALTSFFAACLAPEPAPVEGDRLRPCEGRPGHLEAEFFGDWLPCPAPSASGDRALEPITLQALFRRWMARGAHPSVTSYFAEALSQGTPRRYLDEAARFVRQRAQAAGEDPDRAERDLREAFESAPREADELEFAQLVLDNVPAEARSFATAWRNAASPAFYRRQARRVLAGCWLKGTLGEQAARFPAALRARLLAEATAERCERYLAEVAATLAAAYRRAPDLGAPETEFEGWCAALPGRGEGGGSLFGLWCLRQPGALATALQRLRATVLAPCRKLAAQRYLAGHSEMRPLVEDIDA